jgi:hypothetical protein
LGSLCWLDDGLGIPVFGLQFAVDQRSPIGCRQFRECILAAAVGFADGIDALVRIPIEEDGSSGEAAVVADFSPEGAVAIPDGLFITGAGDIYVAFPGLHEIKRVAADGSYETVASAADGLDVPSSVAVGPAGALYVCSFSVAIEPLSNGNGPSVIRIEP